MNKTKEITEKIEAGWLEVRAIIELLGKPKEHIEETMSLLIEKLKTEPNMQITNIHIEETFEQEGMYATFAEIEVIVKKLDHLTGFCFDYMPSSIEIVRPARFEFPVKLLNDLYNDVQMRLHNTDMTLKNTRGQNVILQQNFDAILKNLIIMALRTGDKTFDELSQATGVKPEHLQEIVKLLLPDKIIDYDGKKISLNSKYMRYVQADTKEVEDESTGEENI